MAQKEPDSGRLLEASHRPAIRAVRGLQLQVNPSTLERTRREQFSEDGGRLPETLSTRSTETGAAKQGIVDVEPGEPQQGKANIGR